MQNPSNQNNRRILPILLALLTLLACVIPLAVSYARAGSPVSPDATVTYTRGRVTWDTPSTNGVADLNLFDDPAPDEQYPLIHPFSQGDYCLRIENGVTGNVGYWIYLYTDDPYGIPLEFTVKKTADMTEVTEIPPEIEGKQIFAAFKGVLGGKDAKDIEVDWLWQTKTDVDDTALGNSPTELLYTIKSLVVIEDNNSYHDFLVPSGITMYHRLYVIGYPDGEFKPEGSITRAEVAAIFSRIQSHGEENIATEFEDSFPDVDSESWYAKYVADVKRTGLVEGYPDGSFMPDEPITRAEFASMVVRYIENSAGKLKKDSSDFPDVGLLHWARAAIKKAAGKGIVEGYPDGSFRPDQPITRAEAVTMVNRMLERRADEKYVDTHLDSLVSFSDITDNEYWAYYQIYEAANNHYCELYENSEDWKARK